MSHDSANGGDPFEDLPDDPETAFLKLEAHFRAEMEEKIGNETFGEYNATNDKVGYIAKTLGVRDAYGLDILSDWRVPSSGNFADTVLTSFLTDIDYCRVVMQVRAARRTSEYSVKFDLKAKEKIHHFTKQIREIFLKLEVPDRKRDALLNKLSALDNEVDRNRTRFDAYAAAAIEVAGVVREYGETLTPLKELIDSIGFVFHGAKKEEPPRLPAPAEMKRIEPPRAPDPPKQQAGRAKVTSIPRKTSLAEELDDDIPF